MKKAVFAVALVLLSAGALRSQAFKGQARVIGVVTDEQGKPLEGVRVKLFLPSAGGGLETKTDREGRWVGAWISKGAWNVDFEKVGYEPRKITVDIVEQKRNPEVTVTLKKVEGLVLTEELESLLTKGNALFDQKKYDEALAAYDDILQKYPDAYIMWKNVGNAYFALEKYDLAEQAYRKVLDKDPANADAMVLIGNTWVNRGDTAQALEWYGKIQVEQIKDPVALYNVGTSYYNNSKFQEALACYRRSVEIQPSADSLYQLGLTYLNLNQKPESIAAFEKYLAIDPDSPRSAQVKGFLEYLKK